MGNFFKRGAKVDSKFVAIILRRGYGLGAMAMTGGSFLDPIYTASWPNGEFGGMGLEGYVKLGFKKELEAEETEDEVQVQEGESLEDIKAKLKPKKSTISADMLDTANTYDDKVAVIRMIVGDEAGKVSNVFRQLMKKDV